MIKINKKLTHRLDDAVEKLENDIKKRYTGLSRIELYMDGDKNSLFLSDVNVKKSFRKIGIGTLVMKDIVLFADVNEVPIVLTPSPERDTKEALDRLILFYNKFGFVVNRGNNTDVFLREPDVMSMYRRPVKVNVT